MSQHQPHRLRFGAIPVVFAVEGFFDVGRGLVVGDHGAVAINGGELVALFW